jgi:hypothetical protein
MDNIVIAAIGLIALGYVGKLVYQQVWGNKGCNCSSGDCCSKKTEDWDCKDKK